MKKVLFWLNICALVLWSASLVLHLFGAEMTRFDYGVALSMLVIYTSFTSLLAWEETKTDA